MVEERGKEWKSANGREEDKKFETTEDGYAEASSTEGNEPIADFGFLSFALRSRNLRWSNSDCEAQRLDLALRRSFFMVIGVCGWWLAMLRNATCRVGKSGDMSPQSKVGRGSVLGA